MPASDRSPTKKYGTNDARLILSALELKVALLSRAGLSRWQTAKALDVREGTVKSQLERVTDKLGSDWREAPCWHWPDLDEEALVSIHQLKAAAPTASSQLAATAGPNLVIEPSEARQAFEGALDRAEAAILQLQGLPSQAGRQFLRNARSFQFEFIALGKEGRMMYFSGPARFWLKTPLAVLTDNKYLRFWHSDTLSEAYRPAWLPYLARNRARGAKAAYYRISSGTALERAKGHLQLWVADGLGGYVDRLHAAMHLRWQALEKLAAAAGKNAPPPPPTPAELLLEARQALQIGG